MRSASYSLVLAGNQRGPDSERKFLARSPATSTITSANCLNPTCFSFLHGWSLCASGKSHDITSHWCGRAYASRSIDGEEGKRAQGTTALVLTFNACYPFSRPHCLLLFVPGMSGHGLTVCMLNIVNGIASLTFITDFQT